ncbi:MAG: YicC family protein [Clostridia bacterium]|nr:YicC family protein [Clostridia bacterium]
MVKSMTGYGRCSETVENMEITAEIKAVNHRYFEFSSRVPRQFGFLDEKIKNYVKDRVNRGKTEVYISINMLDNEAVSVEVNQPLAKAYVDALEQLKEIYSLSGEIKPTDISRFPDVLSIHKQEQDEDAIFEAVKSVLSKAVDAFVEMRTVEGKKLREDITSRCDTIIGYVCEVESLSKQSVVTYRDRLEEKMRELLGDVKVDEQRLLTETAIFADKVAVDEETVRLKSHIEQLKGMLDSNEPVGRKIDFLVQEMNREANTTGSKCSDIEITRIVVEIKSEIEKIREQIQNIE